MLFLCTVECVCFGIENPLNSLQFTFDCIKTVLETSQATRVVCHVGALGASSIKALEIYNTLPPDVAVRFFSFDKRAAYDRFAESGVSPSQLALPCGKWTCGNPNAMAKSSAYPEDLCVNIVMSVEAVLMGTNFMQD